MFRHRLAHFKQSTKIYNSLKNRFQLPEKWKGGRVEEWSKYWQGVLGDYKAVASDVIEGAKTKPFKSTVIASGLAVLYTAFKTNPDEQSFYDTLINAITSLSMVCDPIRNPKAEQHFEFIQRCDNQGVLRRVNLIFFTLVWIADYSKGCNLYAAQCKYLKPRFLTFYDRIIDVGAFGIWWNMQRKMQQFDINPSEWEGKT